MCFLPDRPDRFASFGRKDKLAATLVKENEVLSVLLTSTEEHIKHNISRYGAEVAREAHNLKVAGSIPVTATN